MVYVPGADLEGAIVEAVVDFLESRYGESLPNRRLLDRTVRDEAAVEMLVEGTTRRFAIEHTRLNSFRGQIQDDAQLLERLWPVTQHLDGRVPGRFELSIEAGAITRLPRSRTPAALQRIAEWVLREGPALDAERERDDDDSETVERRCSVSETLPGVPFELQLTRKTTTGSDVYVARRIPNDFDEQRHADVARAFDAKNPKLARWSQDGRERLLVLETRDFQLQNAWATARSVESLSRERHDLPELVYLVETDFGSWQLWVLKENESYMSLRQVAIGPVRIGVAAPPAPNNDHEN